MKNKYAREYSDLKSLKSDEMSFQLHEAKYGWKMLVEFKWSFPKFVECYGPFLSVAMYLNYSLTEDSNNFRHFKRKWFTAEAR